MYEMVYDGELRRVRKRFVKDGGERNVYYVRDLSGEVLAVYTDTVKPHSTVHVFEQTEVTLKASTRIGIHPVGRDMLNMFGPVLRRCRDRKRYELKNHLGNVLAVITDRKLTHRGGSNQVSYFKAQQIAAADYYPYGQLHPGRYVDLRDYRYGYNGKEREERGEFGGLRHYFYRYRIYNPALGRFIRVDPMAKRFAWVTPYNYAENSPIAYVDLWGLQRFSIHSSSFAPYDRFGIMFEGDGDNRRFSTNPSESSRIYGRIDLYASETGISIIGEEARGAITRIVNSRIFSTYSEAYLESKISDSKVYSKKSVAILDFHLKGNNDLLFIVSPNIDVKGKIMIIRRELDNHNSKIDVIGWVYGDKFPSNETYITDQYGMGVFLGVSGAEGSPFTSLWFDNNMPMSKFKFSIFFDNIGKIYGVQYKDKLYTVEEWNSQFIKLDPKEGNVSTNKF